MRTGSGIASICAALISALLLAGCGKTASIGSVLGGECKLYVPSEFALLGKTPYDQRAIDENEAALRTGCNLAPPKERPAELDAPPAPEPPVAKPKTRKRLKLSLRARVKQLVMPRAAAASPPAPTAQQWTAPVSQPPQAAPVEAAPAETAPKPVAVTTVPVRPLDPVEELLGRD